MATKTTFIKIDRNIVKWRWYTEPNTLRVFLHLLLNANTAARRWGNITLQRGELATSISGISADLGLSYNTTKKAIRNLQSTNEISVAHHPHCTVITIENYNKYQSIQDKPKASKKVQPWVAKGMTKEAYDKWANQ